MCLYKTSNQNRKKHNGQIRNERNKLLTRQTTKKEEKKIRKKILKYKSERKIKKDKECKSGKKETKRKK